jgi:hypothetical protein
MQEDESTPVENQEEVVNEPESMDDIIEKEAEAELDQERQNEDEEANESNEDDESGKSDENQDDDPDAEAENQESVEDDEEEPEEVEEEPVEIDTSSFSEMGLEAVPDDYKPKDWKSFLADTVEVIRGEVNKESRAMNEQQQAFQQEVAKVDSGWQEEINELQKAGALPKDPKELEAATKEVFQFMVDTNKKNANNPNKQLWSFETAYKLKNAGVVNEKRNQEIAARRKARAGAANSSGNSEGGSKVPKATKGMSLDDIIANELGL